VDVEDMAHVVATIGGHVIFEGVPERIAARRDGIECVGYGPTASNWATVDSGAADRARTEIIAATALAAVPWFTVGEVPSPTDPSRQAWSEALHMTVAQIVETVCKAGADGASWLFGAWENRVASIRSTAELGEPVYQLAYDPATMEIWWDYSEVADAVRATYQDSEGRQRVTSWVYRSGVDRTSNYLRRVTLSAAGPPATLMQFLTTWMAEHSRPKLTGTITLDGWRGLTLPSGLEVPGYVPRFGEPVEITGFGRTYLSRTNCNLTTGQSRYELATPPLTTMQGLMARVQETNTAVRTGRDPVTGNRAGFDAALLQEILRFLKEGFAFNPHRR
jgi:hypothetical protein